MKVNTLALAFSTVFIAGMMYIFSREMMNAGLSPIEVGVVRETGTAFFFAIFLLLFDRSAFRIKLGDLPLFIIFAIFNVSSNLAMFYALKHLPVNLASTLQMTNPYFVMVFSLFLFKIKITPRKIAACGLAFIGCLLISGFATGNGHICPEGVLCGVFSAITLAAFTIGGRFVGERGYTENTSMMYFFGLSALMMLPLKDPVHIANVITSDAVLIIDALVLCLVCTLLVNFLIIYCTRRMDPGTYSIILSMSIVVSSVSGLILFGEPMSLLCVIGIILMITSMVVLESQSLFGRKQTGEDGLSQDDGDV